MPSREWVNCSHCGSSIRRVTWNYAKSRPVSSFFCDTTCKGAWQKLQRESLGYDQSWLEDQYHAKRKSANQIAREIGRDPKRVWEWIKDYGMETRPRGTDYGQGFQAGMESPFKGMTHSDEAKEKIRQARLLDGHVPYMKDGKHWLHHDGAVSPNWKGGVTPERQALYSSEAWTDAVKAVWERDQAKCQRCGKNHNDDGNRGTFHIHHIKSFADHPMLRSDAENLILLCKPCHLWVHSKANENGDLIG